MTKAAYHHGDLKNALVQAGIEILSEDGLPALSLRKVAARAGVSHSAPYAHFTDKQALIAAIALEGFQQLYERIQAAMNQVVPDPEQRLVEVACAYVRFAQESPATFKLMFSGILENQGDNPDLAAISRTSFSLLVELVRAAQQSQTLPEGPVEVLAVSLWSLVHGLTSLLLERQISHTILDQYTLEGLVKAVSSPLLSKSPML